MKNRLPEIFAGLAILIAILLLLHQKLTHHYWINLDSAWHHESVEACFLALAIGLLLGKYLGKRRG
jgi:TRAP-type C4-dicarboxylate transport system permease small subunit